MLSKAVSVRCLHHSAGSIQEFHWKLRPQQQAIIEEDTGGYSRLVIVLTKLLSLFLLLGNVHV